MFIFPVRVVSYMCQSQGDSSSYGSTGPFFRVAYVCIHIVTHFASGLLRTVRQAQVLLLRRTQSSALLPAATPVQSRRKRSATPRCAAPCLRESRSPGLYPDLRDNAPSPRPQPDRVDNTTESGSFGRHQDSGCLGRQQHSGRCLYRCPFGRLAVLLP